MLKHIFLILLLSWSVLQAEVKDLSVFQDMPKTELHLHLGGAYPIEYLHSIATDEQKMALDASLDRLAKGMPYHECFYVFTLVSQIINTEERVENGVKALCRDLKKDGVRYAEIRTGVKDLQNGYDGYLQAVLRGLEEEDSGDFHVRLLLSIQRNSAPEYARKTVDLAIQYKDRGVVGIDISGNSLIGDINSILPELLRAKREGLQIALHIGESMQETGQRELLEVLRPDRIGHGVHLEKDALQFVLENKIPLEVCLTSSVLVEMVDHVVKHLGVQYHYQNHPIIICTDDPLIFRTSLSKEFSHLHDSYSFEIEAIEQLAKQAIEYAFISEEEKEYYRKLF